MPLALGMVDALHQRLSIFLAGFHGAPTRWLDQYLSWFVWLGQAGRSDADGLRMLSGQTAAGSYENTRRQMVERPQSFWGYWERKRPRQCWTNGEIRISGILILVNIEVLTRARGNASNNEGII